MAPIFFSLLACLLLSSNFTKYRGVLAQTTVGPVSLQDNSGFIGWYLGPSTTQALTDPESWTTSGNYARGCPTSGACAYATDCQGNSITYDDGKTSACNQCRTMTIFQTVPYGTPSATNIFCANYWVAFTVFRELPATTTSSVSSTITIATSASTSTTLEPSSTSRTSVASTKVSNNALPVDQGQSNNTWIAGAVIGPIAGVALIVGILAWFIYRRRATHAAVSPQEPFLSPDFQPHREAFAPPQEMDSARYPAVHELSSYK